MSKACQICGGLVMAANEVTGYGGPICNGNHATQPSTGGSKPCDRKYNEGAYTARIVNGVARCPSCGLPCKEH